MSIDFDSVALQAQQEEEEEYDPEDYAREQELHRLLTDLPDDMLEDSRDGSSSELDYSPCSDPNTDRRPPHRWEQQNEWTDNQGRPTTEGDYAHGYDQGEYMYEDAPEPFDSHGHLHPHGGQEYMNGHGGYVYPSLGTEESAVGKDFSTDEGYQHESYPAQSGHPGAEYHQPEGESEAVDYDDQTNSRQTFQEFDGDRPGESAPEHYKALYNPHQPRMFNTDGPRQDGRFDELQRQFLDGGQNSADSQQVAQLQILNKAQSRQMEEMEQKLEDCKRKMRYLEHQYAIVKDEKEGLAVSLTEAGHVIEEVKEREVQLQGKVKALELQVQAQADREQESMKKQRVAEAAVDSMKQQMAELCRSETLSRAREQHDHDLAAMREQHESRMLALQQSLDSRTRDLEEQTELCQRLREQVKKVEREREEEKLERAGIINTLTKRLEESQQQCANLLQTGSAQENNHLRMQLQQAQSLKAINDNMNKSLQEELADLKEQITLYESGVRFGVISLDSNGEWENQLSDSYVDLGIKKANWRNSKFHSSPLSAVVVDGSQSKEDMVAELKGELQRFLGSLKGKRKKISHLQEELQKAQSHAQDLRSQLDMAQKSVRDSKVRETCLEKHLETSSVGGVSQEELVKLQKEQQCLQEFVKTVERQKEELRRSEEKLKADNLELCTKMREMIQDFDQEKQEAAERYDRTQQQYRDDVVNRVRAELAQDHAAQVEELTAQSQLKIQHLESQLAEVSKEMLGVQECYITVCREKDSLEEKLRSKMEEERRSREEELKTQMGEEKARALEELKGALEKQHQTALASSRALWTQEHATELQQQVQSQLLQAKTAWQDEHSKATQSAMERVEKEWARRLEEVQGRGGSRRVSGGRGGRAQERGAQTEATDSTETLLTSQKLKLQQEADEARVRAVEEAVKRTEQELRDKHLADLTQQVESAVTRARSRWLEEMTSFPEYKARLQTERQEWEKRQAEVVAQQVSAALKEAEARWLQTHLRKLKELEAESESKRAELREEAVSLRRLLEQRREEEAVALRAELARARASWGREKQEEMSRLQAQNEQDYRSFLEQHRAKLEQALAQAREEAERRSSELLQQREAGFQKLQRERQEEWSSQQERRSREERESFREEALVEVRAALEELQKLLGDGLERNEHNGVEGRSSSSPPKGALWTCVQAGGRDLISKAVAQAKQEWKKSGQGKPGRVSKELQDQRDVCQSPASQPCSSRSCTERVSRLQKQCQDLQRHLEKACRQLQQAVRENKASTQRLKEEHEAAIQKVQQENERKLEEARRASGESRPSHAAQSSESQQSLQAGLEEMKDQYMRAVGKIRGDMLRYLQESKERAAAMIRQEVLRERRDTARKMRRYYLSCLQDLLKDAGTSQGAEKKIISAASKLAHMTKVLETPLSKRREGKTRSAHSTSKTKTTAAEDTPRRTLTSPSDPSQAGGHSLAHKQDAKGSEASANSDHKTGTGTLKTNAVTGQEGTKPTVTSPCQNSLKLMKNKSPEAFSKAPPPQLLSRPLEDGASCFSVCDITTANVTTRIHSRELFLSGGCPSQSEAACATGHTSKPFLIEEDPVRDEGSQSDWSSGALTRFEHLFPSVDQMNRKPFSLGSSHSTASISETDEDDDLTCFRTITTITKSDSGNCREASKVSVSRTRLGAALGATGHREPPSGSEGERLRRFCSKSLFSELKICQDSGFDSPLTVLHK